jgi:hypothetical protein
MVRKLVILVAAYLILGINSCDRGFCKDVDYYDFSKVQIRIKNSKIIGQLDSLNFEINQLDTRYMAINRYQFNLMESAYALPCDYGWKGMKIPLVKIEITSDSDFNEDYPANTLLNDLIIVKLRKDNNHYPPEYLSLIHI